MVDRRIGLLVATLAIVASACSSGGATTAPESAAPPASEAPASEAPASAPASAAAGACTVGVSWNNYQEERWAKWDEPAIKDAIAAGGGTYISNDAKSSAETQASNVANLISQGANVVIVLAQDGTAIKPAVADAIANGVPVIAYDRLIEDPTALYITFDNKLVGKMQAEAVLEQLAEGNFAIIKGNKADANADFLREGMVEAGIPPVDGTDPNGKIVIVGETYTDNWDPKNAQTNMERSSPITTTRSTPCCRRTTAWPAASSRRSGTGLAGKVPVSGQDGDQAALNRVAKGEQTVSVWKDARELGKAAGEAAIALCANADMRRGRQGGPPARGRPVPEPRRERHDVCLPDAHPDQAGQPPTSSWMQGGSTRRPSARASRTPRPSRPASNRVSPTFGQETPCGRGDPAPQGASSIASDDPLSEGA